jgi:hypothetical protein
MRQLRVAGAASVLVSAAVAVWLVLQSVAVGAPMAVLVVGLAVTMARAGRWAPLAAFAIGTVWAAIATSGATRSGVSIVTVGLLALATYCLALCVGCFVYPASARVPRFFSSTLRGSLVLAPLIFSPCLVVLIPPSHRGPVFGVSSWSAPHVASHSTSVSAIDASRDGKTVVTSGREEGNEWDGWRPAGSASGGSLATLSAWDPVSGELRWRVPGEGRVLVSPDGRSVAVYGGGPSESILISAPKILDVFTGRTLAVLRPCGDAAVTALAFTHDSRSLAMASDTICVKATGSAALPTEIGTARSVGCTTIDKLFFARGDETLWVSCVEGGLHAIDARSGARVADCEGCAGDSRVCRLLAHSDDGDRALLTREPRDPVALSASPPSVSLLDVGTCEITRTITLPPVGARPAVPLGGVFIGRDRVVVACEGRFGREGDTGSDPGRTAAFELDVTPRSFLILGKLQGRGMTGEVTSVGSTVWLARRSDPGGRSLLVWDRALSPDP